MMYPALLIALAGAATTPPSSPAGVASSDQRPSVVGVQLSAGVVDGVAVEGTIRPAPWARGDVGVAYNALALGFVGGVTLIPWIGGAVPTLRLAAGRFLEGDVSAHLGSALPAAFEPALRKFGYRFFSAQIGLELGDQNGSLFFVRGGLAWVRSGLDAITYRDGNTTVVSEQNDLSATTPSVQLGAVFHVW